MIVGVQRTRMLENKIKAVLDWLVPISVREVQAFIGFANFYRRFIKDFSKVALPLTKLTKKEETFV